jgi:hypothetical protein
MAIRVLPQPAVPQTRVGRPRGRPPRVISSRPAMPVGAFSIPRVSGRVEASESMAFNVKNHLYIKVTIA